MSKLCYLIKQLTRKLSVRRMFDVFFITLFLFITSSVFAQEKTISGKVVDKKGEVIMGASISVKGTNIGTITDVNGNYSIKVPGSNAVIAVSFVGYTSQEQSVGDQQVLNFTVVEASQQLNEVVVTAMGVKKDAKSIGYTAMELNTSELSKARDVNAINSLTGKVAGLTVGQSSEFLGSPQLVLRGSTDLLYVVDGVPINSDTWNISNDDIESYTILKGPNAAALYGFRGQNGAILMTTKRGSKDKKGFTIEVNSSNLFYPKSFLAMPVRQNQYGYGDSYMYTFGVQDLNQDGGNYKRPNVWGPKMEGQLVQQFDGPIIQDPAFPNDPTKKIRQGTPLIPRGNKNFVNFMENGFLSSNNIALSSSTEKADIRISVSQTHQKGLDPNVKLDISNLNLFAGYNLSKRLRAEGNFNYNYQYSPNFPDVNYGPNSYSYMIQEYGSAQYDITDFKNYWQPGKEGIQQRYAEYGRCNNPYFMAYEWLRGHKKSDMYGYAKVTYEITKELSASFRTQMTTYSLFRSEKLPVSAIIYGQTLNLGEYREDRRNLFENNNDLMLTFNKNLTSKLSLSVLAGGNIRTMDYNSSWASTYYLIVPGVYNLNNTQNPMVPYSFYSGLNVYSGYYSVDLSIDKYATLSTTGRVDKTSTLPEGQNSIFYPSVSMSSVVSDYIKLPKAITFFKLRGSYADVKGALTSPTIGPAWLAMGATNPLGYSTAYYSSYDGPTYANQNTYGFRNLYNNTPSSSYTGTLADASLKAYTVKSYEAGAEMKFLNNRIGAEVTYYVTINGPQIFKSDIAPSSGYESKMINGVTTQKKGWEFTLSANPIRTASGFNWDISGNVSTYMETLKEIYDNATEVLLNDHYYKVGDRLDAYYGYKFYRTPDGQIINTDKGSPLLPNQGTRYKQFLGYINNDYVWGITNTFTYKMFTLNFSWDGRVGGVIHDQTYSDMMQSGAAADLVNGDYGAARLAEWNDVKANNYVMPAGYQGQYVGPGVVVTSTAKPTFDPVTGNITNYDQLTFAPNTTKVLVKSYVTSIQGFPFQEPYMVSRSYAKLRDVTFTVNVPAKLLSKTFIKKASVSFVARNLLYLTSTKRKDIDLDQYAAGFNSAKIGQKSASTNSGSYGVAAEAGQLSFGANASFQTPTVRQYGFNVNLVF